VYERLGTVLVRLFHEDRNLRIRILLDASRSMEAKLDQAGTLAGGLALVGLAHRDSVELAYRRGALPSLEKICKRSPPCSPGSSRSRAATRSRCGAPPRAGAGVRSDRTVLVSDLLWDDETLEGVLEALAASSEAPVVVQTLGDAEKSPDLDGPVTWVDARTAPSSRGTGPETTRAATRRSSRRGSTRSHDAVGATHHWIPVFTSDAIHRVFDDALARAGWSGVRPHDGRPRGARPARPDRPRLPAIAASPASRRSFARPASSLERVR
jgi:hypothetical protein